MKKREFNKIVRKVSNLGKRLQSGLTNIKSKRIETIDGHCIIMDKYITVYTKCFPKGKLFKIKMFIKGRLFLVDDSNKMWIYYLIPKSNKREKKNLFSLGCQVNCHKNLKRLHWSCFWCRERRIIQGKVDNPVQVNIYIDVIHKDIKLNFLRSWLVKNLRSLIEFIGGL